MELTIKFSGFGQWFIYTTYYGRVVSMYTTNAPLIDDIQDGKKSAITTAIKMIRRNYRDNN
jgi:hypothetical protein